MVSTLKKKKTIKIVNILLFLDAGGPLKVTPIPRPQSTQNLSSASTGSRENISNRSSRTQTSNSRKSPEKTKSPTPLFKPVLFRHGARSAPRDVSNIY